MRISTVTEDRETGDDPLEDAPIIRANGLSVYYGTKKVLSDVTLDFPANKVTAIIGPSGCGKSTLLRCFNRMNDLISAFNMTGQILFDGEDLYGPGIDSTEIRYQVGMVFQRPNPFPKSIYDNVAFGPKINGYRGELTELVEQSLRRAALWDEVKDRLKSSALALSGGQQQRLCIARALAVHPRVILMDEPCSALDPFATLAIEELMRELSEDYSIIIVTHNMQQAARASDYTAFLMGNEDRIGELVEFGETRQITTNPEDERTEAYITGRFG
jgi:phosphate transport system ATP-binding protein